MDFDVKVNAGSGQDRTDKDAAPKPLSGDEVQNNEATRFGVLLFAAALFVVGLAVGTLVVSLFASLPIALLVGCIVGIALAACIRIAPQWERVVVLRLGRFNRIAGPGAYVLIPFIEHGTMRVDQRIMNSSFTAEAALTADLVPVDVDAILFWLVWDAKKACLEVENYPQAVLRSAQTAMRDAIGQTNLTELSTRRKQIDHELEELMGQKCEAWGITVISVEIRDIKIPDGLQDALSKEAQAERERDARMILAEVEKDISEMFADAAAVYEKSPQALQLRIANMAYEAARESKGVLVTPSVLSDGFAMKPPVKGE